jgi:hypothetical protein
MKLTVHLHKACVRVLLHCREFSDRHTLEPLFGIDPLPKYSTALPLEANTRVHLVEIVIHNLVTYSGTKGEALLDLLGVLRDKREEAEEEWKTLDELCKQVNFYFSSLARDSDESLEEKRPQKSEAQELRKAVHLYNEATRNDNQVETAASWIGQSYGNNEEWAFRIALSVFSEAPWDTCMEAALDLGQRLSANSSTAVTKKSEPLGSPPVSPLKILAQAGGELLTEKTHRVVRLTNSQLSRDVLDYVWDEYTRRELLIAWLSDLVVSRNPHNRLRGSIAVGFLLLNNFETIQRSVLLRWARADDARGYRQAIGRALSVVAEEGSRLAEVRELLEFWASSSEQELRWAAARAYIYVGLRCSVKDVIKQWRMIVEAEEFGSATINFGSIQWVLINPLHVSLLDAMERFFLNAVDIPEIRRTAFSEGVEGFKHWSDDEQGQSGEDVEKDAPERVTIGFGLMMLIKLARMSVPSDDDSKTWPPVLLTLMEPDKTESPCRSSLLEIFEQLLLDPASQPTALEILREWVNRVERNPRYEAEMRIFIDELLARPRLQGEVFSQLAMNLDLWSPLSHFRVRPSHPELNGLKKVVLVVDGSESALRYWTEIRSLALELGSALSETIVPVMYLLNSGEAKNLTALADTKLDSTDEKPNCSLIAPVMRDLCSRQQQTDAVILIGNGEVFDLADWLDHPGNHRWVLVRVGPDTLLPAKEQKRDEITDNPATAVYERLLRPIQTKTQYQNVAKSSSPISDRWKIDRTSYPLIRIDPLRSYIHLFPIAKIQFERFIADHSQSSWSDEEYAELLRLNPRASFRAKRCTNYEQLFLTGITPEESTAFGAWLGDEYGLPDQQQWLTCYDWMANQPIPEPPEGISDDAFAIWQIIVAERKPRTLLDLSLMSEGIKEWVKIVGKTDRYGGLGCPVQRFHTLSRNPRTLVHLTTLEPRLNAYGFRLLGR